MILVTGGAGYIGSHCVLRLLTDGEDVVVFDSLELGHAETIETLSNAGTKGKLKAFVKGDLKNPSDIAKVFADHRIDAVVHFAAYSQVAESMRDPQKYYLNNVGGTLNLLSAMKDAGVTNSDIQKVILIKFPVRGTEKGPFNRSIHIIFAGFFIISA